MLLIITYLSKNENDKTKFIIFVGALLCVEESQSLEQR